MSLKCPNCKIELKVKHDDVNNTTIDYCDECGFTSPKNHMKIDEMYAFVSVDPKDQNEGVIAFNNNGTLMPMVAADKYRVESLIPIAKKMFDNSGMKVKLLKFTQRSEIHDWKLLK